MCLQIKNPEDRFSCYETNLTLCMLGNSLCFCCHMLTFFKVNFFKKIFQEHLPECQTISIQIRTDILSILILVQIVYKSYQQMTEVNACEARKGLINVNSR